MNLENMIQENPQALVTSYNGVLVADSLEVAERFGKQHAHVIRSIEGLYQNLAAQFCATNADPEAYFIPDSYMDNRRRTQKRYKLTRDGFSLLVMGFTGPAALHWKLLYIEAFNKMEEQLRKTPPDLPTLVTQITTQVVQALLPEIRKAQAPALPVQEEPKKKRGTTLEELPPILTVYDIRDYLRIGQRQAYELARSQDFPTIRIGNRLLIQKSDFEKWLQGKKGYI